MKENLLAFIMALLVCGELWAQTDYPGFRCYVEASGEGTKVQSLAASPVTGTTNMAILLCVEKGQSTELDAVRFVAYLKDQIPKYFEKATFNNYQVNVVDILVKDNDGVTAHAFELAGTLVPYPPADESFVVPPWMVTDVLGQADAIYDFGNYDGDDDGEVDYLAFLVVRFAVGNSNGTTGLSIDDYYYTNDYRNGRQIKIDGNGYMSFAGKQAIIQRKKNPDLENVLSMAAHELGHSLFSFPDVEHGGTTYFNHQSFGDFDPMSSEWGGFHQVASLYNPCFRLQKGWVTPTDASGTKTFSDFDVTGQVYSYSLPSYSNALPSQKYYLTFYTADRNNHWQENWPVPRLSSGNNAGVLVWRTVDGGYWRDRKAMPITLESAHGKWIWNENNPPDIHDINTGRADILNGLDSLQVRNSYIWFKYNPQTGERDVQKYLGSLYQRGSSSCFFDPEKYKTFSFYTNPSSNEIASADESRSITPGFAMKNLRWEGGQAKADFVTGDAAYTITENATLTAGTWYINNTVTVASGVTLTINPGAVLKFASGASLTVSGTLNATGTLSQPIVFTSNAASPSAGDWGAIKFDGSTSHGVLDHVTMQYGGEIDCLNGASVSIRNSTLSNNNYGTMIYNASPTITGNTIVDWKYSFGITIIGSSSSPRISDNLIKISPSNPNYRNCIGIYSLSANTTYLWHNDLSGLNNGMFFVESLWMNFVNPYTWGAVNPNNRIRDCRTALWARQSRVNAGDGGDLGELSSIYNNIDYDLCAQQNTWILANYDYWGGGEPRVTGDGTSIIFGTDNYLTYDPWTGRSLSVQVAANPDTKTNTATVSPSLAVDSESPIVQHAPSSQQSMSLSDTGTTIRSLADDLAMGMSYERNKQYSKAIMHYKRMVKMGRAPFIVLSAIAGIAGRSSETEIVRYLESLSATAGDYQAHALHLLGDIYLANGDPAKAIASYEKLVESFSNSPGARSARFALFYHSLFTEKDRNNASKLLDEIISKYSVDDKTTDVEAAEHLFNDYFSRNLLESEPTAFGKRRASSMDVDSTNTNAASGESGLAWNFPNPFNPTTTILYQIPKGGRVTLRVYDILGREVAVLVDGVQTTGVHSVRFNGENLASGVYFYRLTASGISQLRKMLMVK